MTSPTSGWAVERSGRAIEPLVSRYRDADSPSLDISWALLRLLDERFSQQLRKDLVDHGSGWEVLTATENCIEAVPESRGLYMFVWRPYFKFEPMTNGDSGYISQVLYVGKAGADSIGCRTAGTLRDRYKTYLKHLTGDPKILWSRPRPARRAQLLENYLTLRPLEYWFNVISDCSEIPMLEDRLIKMLNPPCNTQQLPRLVSAGPALPAFRQ